MNPLKSSKDIVEKYRNYILSTFHLNDNEMNENLYQKLNKSNFLYKGPFLELKNNFRPGKSVKSLINEGIIVEEFEKINYNLERPLYLHQENAIRKVKDGKNIIVSTGTGSGKTESFLIPILNELIEEHKINELKSGVRAMVLYPMNALASDQLKRLKELLKNYPEITFGSYTGEVLQSYKEALELYRNMYGEDPLPNELISREQIKDNPPHILITNYSMLEYLLLRPKDSILFNKETWKYIVIDEAHMYTGAKAIEIGMLLRRLKNKIVGNKNIKFILTSASLGRGIEDNPEIVNFAEKLTDEKFYEEDIITGITDPPLLNPKNEVSLSEYIKIYSEKKDSLSEKEVQSEIYNFMSLDKRLFDLKNLIESEISLEEIKTKLFSDNDEAFDAFLYLLNNAIDNNKNILPIKYHLFIKSLEGAFARFKPNFEIFFERKEIDTINDEKYKVFEIGVCRNCNDVYIIGNVKQGEVLYLDTVPNDFSEEYKDAVINYFLIKNPEDMEDEISSKDVYELCGKCGKLHIKGMKNLCSCGNENYLTVIRVEPEKEKKVIHTCKSCGKVNTTGNIIKRFLLSQEAATSVVAETLYKNLDEIKVKQIQEDDLFGTIADNSSSKDKQLLVFSDSRQQASFFASFFDSTYEKFFNRRLILKILKNGSKDFWDFSDLLMELQKELKKYRFFDSEFESEDERRNRAYKILLHEILNSDGKNSLEELGLIDITFDINILSNPFESFGLSMQDTKRLLDVLISSLRKRGAIDDYLNLSKAEWGEFSYKNNFVSVTKEKTGNKEQDQYKFSWIGRNAIEDFLLKVLENKEILRKYQDGIFQLLIHKGNSILLEKGSSYQLNLKKIKIGRVSEDKLFRCSKCHKITPINIKNKCSNYRCNGTLEKLDISKDIRGNYYRAIFNNDDLEIINTSEHTAQLDKEEAKIIQQRFIEKDINILSCSTTFEVGIDVGDLESVLMRNIPPTPANYAQRAGRAGRRAETVAFIVTYASLKSHDFIFYNEPYKMISGKVAPPVFDISNKKIALRHISAYVLGRFWFENQEYFYNENGKDLAINFFGENSVAIVKFIEFLDKNLNELKKELLSIFPESLKELIVGFSWKKDIVEKIDLVNREYFNEIKELEALKLSSSQNEEYYNAEKVKYTISTLKNKNLIQFISQSNLIPKYGFPVDTVSLETPVEDKLSLNRDLQMALKEYAPGAELVANKKTYKSKYIKRVEGMELLSYSFKICDCNQINKKNEKLGVPNKCIGCGKDIKDKEELTYVIPQFGFVPDYKFTKKAGSKKPENVYFTEKFFGGEMESKENSINVNIGNREYEIISAKNAKMTVIGKGKGQGFFICDKCGYGEPVVDFKKSKRLKHKNSKGFDCDNTLVKKYLGYDYETDVTLIHTQGLQILDKEEQLSVLYAFLNGMSEALEIERRDIDGTFFSENNKSYLVIFDNVPGGAGHSRRLLKEKEFKLSIEKAKTLVNSCTCGIETSCYSCLRNYSNQNVHTKLRREGAVKFFE